MSNKTNNLGLPIEYQQIPEWFDAHNVNQETEVKNALIEKLLNAQHVKTVLDMTCGTGSQVFYLDQHGYDVMGSDFSPALIDIARDKAKAQNQDIRFVDGDMRDIKLGQFDAIITIFNAIGHLPKKDFEKALQNIHANLKPGGVYVFDIFNMQAITGAVIADFSCDIESVVNGNKIRNVQHSEIDRERSFLISHDHYTVTKPGSEPEEYRNSFSLQIYTAGELQEMLEQNGFEVVKLYDMQGNDFVPEKSLNILTVARKN